MRETPGLLRARDPETYEETKELRAKIRNKKERGRLPLEQAQVEANILRVLMGMQPNEHVLEKPEIEVDKYIGDDRLGWKMSGVDIKGQHVYKKYKTTLGYINEAKQALDRLTQEVNNPSKLKDLKRILERSFVHINFHLRSLVSGFISGGSGSYESEHMDAYMDFLERTRSAKEVLERLKARAETWGKNEIIRKDTSAVAVKAEMDKEKIFKKYRRIPN